MIDYGKMRRKFPSKKSTGKSGKAAILKAIAKEYELKKAELGASAPLIRRGFPYYMTIITALLVVGGLVLTAISKRGVVADDLAGEKAEKSIHHLAVALSRYCYHTGRFPATEEGLEQLASKRVSTRGWNGPYVKKVKQDPWKHDYVYAYNGADKLPTLYSLGPDGRAGTTDDVIADPRDFDAAFRDTSWTEGWMPQHLRDIVVAQDERHKKALEEEVEAIRHPKIPVEGVTDLADGWRFAPVWRAYGSNLACPATSACLWPDEGPGIQWQDVRVPHDWAAGLAFSTNSVDAQTGALPWRGMGWYRRSVTIPEKAKGRRIALVFAGVAGDIDVFVGRDRVGGAKSPRGAFEVDVTEKVAYGSPTELTVRVANTGEANPPFYPGAGLVGEVRLAIDDPKVRIVEGTLSVSALSLSEAAAKMRIAYDTPSGAVTNDFDVPAPRLWTPMRPFLYKGYLEGRLYQYAVRTYSFREDGTFLLNGRPFTLRGVRLGVDMGFLGMAFSREAARRRLQAMKDAGVNAVRFVDGVPCRTYLDLCEEMGFVVWDRSFDGVPGLERNFAHDAFDRLGGGASSGNGLCDVAFQPKRGYHLVRAAWSDYDKVVEIIGGWTRDAKPGDEVVVECATCADEVELFVNGESAGRRSLAPDAAERVVSWKVPFDPGEIKVIAYQGGKYMGETARRTAFAPAAVTLAADRQAIADGELALVHVAVEDRYAVPSPASGVKVGFSLEGPGKIVAVATGRHPPVEPFGETASHTLEGGRAVVAVRRNVGGSGLPLKLTATSPSLRSAVVVLPRR